MNTPFIILTVWLSIITLANLVKLGYGLNESDSTIFKQGLGSVIRSVAMLVIVLIGTGVI